MRFLCFHGLGTNARIFKAQMDPIISAFDPEHTFVFMNGPLRTDELPGALVPGFERNKERYRYLPTDDKVSTMPSILKILMNFIETKGPFDGLIGYSEGGLVAGTLLVMEAMRELPGGSRFKCGIFFCAPPPMDTKRALKIGSKARSLHVSIDGVIFDLPTAHIWAKGSDVYPGMGKDLVGLCAPAMREEVVHDLGHVVPGAGTGEILKESIRAIQRTIERARCM